MDYNIFSNLKPDKKKKKENTYFSYVIKQA